MNLTRNVSGSCAIQVIVYPVSTKLHEEIIPYIIQCIGFMYVTSAGEEVTDPFQPRGYQLKLCDCREEFRHTAAVHAPSITAPNKMREVSHEDCPL